MTRATRNPPRTPRSPIFPVARVTRQAKTSRAHPLPFRLRCCALMALLGACAAPQTQVDTAETPAHRARAAQAELLGQSQVFARAGDWMRAEQYVALALEQGADSARVTRLLVDACVRGQRYRAAAEHAERHLRSHPGDSQLRLVYALLLLGLDQPTSAARELEQLLTLEPANAVAHFVLGSLQREHVRDPVSADNHFRAYLALAPQGAYAERARSLTLIQMSPAGAALPPQASALPPESAAPVVDTALPRAAPPPSASSVPMSIAPESFQ
jgi:tetratricopeptide (TPR) repeat protein